MPLKKKTTSKRTLLEKTKKEKENKKEQYFYAVGGRKNAVARVRMYFSETGEREITVNNKKLKDYFRLQNLQSLIISPLKATGTLNNFRIAALVKGGGFRGQAEALRLAIARALVKYNQDFKRNLRSLGFLTRDARIVERKKAGLKKARRAPQWAKR